MEIDTNEYKQNGGLKMEIGRETYYRALDGARQEGVSQALLLISAKMDGGDADKISLLLTDPGLRSEMFKKYRLTRWKRDLSYRVKVFCPECKEEHNYYIIQIDEDEQDTVEEFYRTNASCSSLRMLLEGKFPLRLKRSFLCPCCGAEFEAVIPITREDYLGRKTGAMRDDNVLQAW
ncbi:MAG: hypothetical protein LUF35_09320 [Lachnospiraceae bacterium]|nr:hypothetical protein [Lachnospiraceae bacterium]